MRIGYIDKRTSQCAGGLLKFEVSARGARSGRQFAQCGGASDRSLFQSAMSGKRLKGVAAKRGGIGWRGLGTCAMMKTLQNHKDGSDDAGPHNE